MNFNQQLQEAYEAGYYRALNELVTASGPVQGIHGGGTITPDPEYKETPVDSEGRPVPDRLTPRQRWEYDKYQAEREAEKWPFMVM
jgi:hypothetical protein